MITKSELLASIQHEVDIIKHLAGKLTPEQVEYRPTPGQRSMTELLRYLTVCAIIPARNLITGNWDHAAAMSAEAESVTLDSFPAAMDAQMAALRDIIDGVDVADALERDVTLPWGAPIKQGRGFVDMIVKTLTAYRMQLFLWSKESGNADLSPANCWAGVDQPAPPSDDGDAE